MALFPVSGSLINAKHKQILCTASQDWFPGNHVTVLTIAMETSLSPLRLRLQLCLSL